MKQLVFALLALAVLAGCPESPKDQASEPVCPAPRHPVPLVGEVYAFKLLGGAMREDEVVAVGSHTVTVIREIIVGAEVKSTQTCEEPLEGDGPTATITSAMSFKKTGSETVAISGKSFPCEIREAKPATTVIKEWISPHWPHVLRTSSGPFVTLELLAVKPKKDKEAKKK